MTIFPNPVSDRLIIRLQGSMETIQAPYMILDPAGRLVKQGDLNLKFKYAELPVSELPTGTYIIRILEADQWHQYRIVKQ